jgi:hypothetical protein
MFNQILNTIGLLLNIGGVGILFYYSWPQPTFEEGVGLELEDGNVLPDGRTVVQYKEDMQKLKREYQKRSRLALVLVMLGFALQLFATWVC